MTNTSQWSGFYSKLLQSKDFSNSLLPDATRKLNGVQKAVLVSAIRPDLLCQLLQQAADEMFSAQKESVVAPLDQALKLARPII